MGVVHKLSDDVVDFILAQKKVRPEISVRKLSDVVFKEFQIVISKSSIGSVLKNANLNSPIGRHGLAVDEHHDVSKKLVGKFTIPEQKKKQIFVSQKLPAPPASSVLKIVKVEPKPIPKVVLPPRAEPPIISKMSTVKSEEKEATSVVSNLESKRKLSSEVIKHVLENAGMVFLKAAEWNFAGGSILAKILKDELERRFDVNYDFLADLLLFPELFDQKKANADDPRRVEKLFNASEKNDVLNPRVYASLMAAANNIHDCGLKLSIEMEILLRGVSTIKIINQKGAEAFYSSRNRMIDLNSVQSEPAQEISVAEAVREIDFEIVKNVHSAVFHYFSKVHKIDSVIKFLLDTFGRGGLKEVVFQDAQGKELLKNNYFPEKTRTFVVAQWGWKERWPDIATFAGTDFEALAVLGKTFYYKMIVSPLLFEGKVEGVKAIIVSSSPSPSDEPLVVLLTNITGDGEMTQKAVLDFLYSWSGFGEESGYALESTSAGKEDVFRSIAHDLESESALSQSLPILRKTLNLWVQQYFFVTKAISLDEKIMENQFYRLPGFIRDESDRVAVITLETPPDYGLLDVLKNAVRHFNFRMFRDLRGRRILLKVSAPFKTA